MIQVKFCPTNKQAEALNYLYDNFTKEILFGGAAGGGKSLIGCVWVVTQCLQYKGVRYLIGRSVLKTLKETTLKTLFEVFKMFKIDSSHYNYNTIEGSIVFYNGSEILLKNLEEIPSDPEFDSLGSLEITGAFIDEAAQISEKCKNIVSSRIRYKLKEYGLTGKIFLTCNPSQGWIYNSFYKPFTENTLPEYKKFIQATLRDNPHIDSNYAERLSLLDLKSRKRLLDGDWNYFIDEDTLVDYDSILKIFQHKEIESETKYISLDCAGSGKDKTVIMVWSGLTVIEIITQNVSTADTITEEIHRLEKKYNILRKNIVYDRLGLGFFGNSKNTLQGAYAFGSGDKANQDKIYRNLRAESAYKLAELINRNEICIMADSDTKNIIIEELLQLKSDKENADKLCIISKDNMKKQINRSPDYLDCLMMRMCFETKKYSGNYNYNLINIRS